MRVRIGHGRQHRLAIARLAVTPPAAQRLEAHPRLDVLEAGAQGGVAIGVADAGPIGRGGAGHRGHRQPTHLVVGIPGGNQRQFTVHGPGIAKRQQRQPPRPGQAAGRRSGLRLDHGEEPRPGVGRQRGELAVDARERLQAARGALDPHWIGRAHHRAGGTLDLRAQARGGQARCDGLLGGAELGGTGQADAAQRGGEHRPVGRRRRGHRLGQRLDRLPRKHLGGVGGGDRGSLSHAGIGIRQQRDDLPNQRRGLEPAHRAHGLGAHPRVLVLESLGEEGHRVGD